MAEQELTWAERLAFGRLNRFYNKLPFRGRALFFGVGVFMGGGGFAGVSLYFRAEGAAHPPDDEPDVLPDPPPLSGELRRWFWWPLPHWKNVNAELSNDGLLILGAGCSRSDDGSMLVAGHTGVNGSGRCATAIPLSGTNVTPSAKDPASVALTTAGGDRETLRWQSTQECQEWVDALETASTGATVGQQQRSQAFRRMLDVSFPKNWSAPMDNFRLVKLSKKSEEYRRVADLAVKQQYVKTSNGTPFVSGRIKVLGVSRVQSPRVWEAYCMRRSLIASENQGDPNEKWLWHGTTHVDKVLKKGFDPRVCLLTGMFGGGVYFADLSTKSVRYTSVKTKGDKGQLLLCRVSLGRQMIKTMPERDLRRPPDPFPLYPDQFTAWWYGWKYHSLFAPAGRTLLMNEYIVYHSNQGVPEYLVDFELV